RVKAEMELLILPGKIRILRGNVFRRSDPAIVGVEILEGVVRPKYPLVNEDRKRIGTIVHVQDQGKDVPEAGVGKQVAVSIDKPTVGRHIFEGEVLYVDVPPQHVKILLSQFKDSLSPGEMVLLSEIICSGGSLLYFRPRRHSAWGAIILIASLVDLTGSFYFLYSPFNGTANLFTLFASVGPLVGLAGSLAGINWKSPHQTPNQQL